eukprot:Filipodium_phascolosomae@DN262_c0_g1_i1.p1
MYSMNVPLDDGIDDQTFLGVFEPIVTKAVEVYRPGAMVLQCGADSLTGDRLGKFNLSSKGHAACVAYCLRLGLPLMLLGGGGYTIRNVARCWAYETMVAVGKGDLYNSSETRIPPNEFWDYYTPEHRLHLPAANDYENKNARQTIQAIVAQVLSNLSSLEFAPGIQFSHMPPEYWNWEDQRLRDELALGERELLLDEDSGGGSALGSDKYKALINARILNENIRVGR